MRKFPALVALAVLAPVLGGAADANGLSSKVGVYIWGTLASDLPTAMADSQWLGADQATRVFIGPGTWWDPKDPLDNAPLDQKMLRLDYQELLRSFPVVVLTAYDSASFSAPYRGSHQASDRLSEKTNATISRTPFRNVVPNFLRFADALPTGDASARLSDDYLTAVREEFRRFAFELSRTPGKKIISNWEFENDCPDVRTWDICRTYYQARIDGIVAGREQARRLGYPAEVYTMFEFTIVPGFAGRLSGLVEVGGKLRGVDFWSYSSWWSFNNPFTSAEGVKGSYVGAVRLIDEFAVSRGLSRQIMIGEVGELWDLFPQGDRLKAAIQGALEAGAVYVFNWVLYEQPGQRDEFGRDASHYGKFFLNRTLTPQGEMFRRFLWEPYRIPREVGVAPQ